MIYSPESCACFTGHRVMSESELRFAAEQTANTVAYMYEQGVVNYYAGGAIGFDLAASVTVLNLKNRFPLLTLNLALPCPDHMKKWHRSEIELFERVRLRADSVICVSDTYHRGCMQTRNRYMADRSSVCIAYMTQSKGGTCNTVNYAMKKGLKIINLAKVPASDQICLDL